MVFVTLLLPLFFYVYVFWFRFARVSLLIFDTQRHIKRDYFVLVLLPQYGTAESIYGIISYLKRSAAILQQATVTISAVYMESVKLISVTCLTDIDHGTQQFIILRLTS
jgi:hypothetical protein